MPQNPLRLKSIHHVKIVVGNAKQAAYYYRKAFGFSQFAYSGLETGSRDLACYAMEQGKARFIFATPYRTKSPEAAHLHTHGDGIVDIAFHVEDADAAYHAAVERGAEPALHPTTLNDEYGSVAYGPLFAAISITVFGTLAVYLSINQQVMKGLTAGSVKG